MQAGALSPAFLSSSSVRCCSLLCAHAFSDSASSVAIDRSCMALYPYVAWQVLSP